MKQHKIVNINVKIKLSRIPSFKEKQNLAGLVASVLDIQTGSEGLYNSDIKDDKSNEPLNVDHHYVTVRNMGR